MRTGPLGGVWKPETGMLRLGRAAVDRPGAIEDREVARRLRRVAVGDDERPAGLAVPAGAGLDVGHRVAARARGADQIGHVDDALEVVAVGRRVVDLERGERRVARVAGSLPQDRGARRSVRRRRPAGAGRRVGAVVEHRLYHRGRLISPELV